MRMLSYLCVAAGLLSAGCGDKGSAPTATTNAASDGVLSAPGNYLSAAAKAQQSAVKTVDTTSLDKAIQLFNVERGRNPKDLNELVEQKYIPQIPATPSGTKLVYDANAGTVKVEKE